MEGVCIEHGSKAAKDSEYNNNNISNDDSGGAVEIGECGDYQNNSGHLSCSPRKIVPHGDKRRDNTNCRGGMQRINGIGKRGIHSLPEKLRHGHTHYEDAEREGYPPPPAGDAILVYILRCSEQTGKTCP